MSEWSGAVIALLGVLVGSWLSAGGSIASMLNRLKRDRSDAERVTAPSYVPAPPDPRDYHHQDAPALEHEMEIRKQGAWERANAMMEQQGWVGTRHPWLFAEERADGEKE